MKRLELGDPLESVAGVGPKLAAQFAKDLDLHSVADLLRHFPRRLDKLGELTAIRDLPLGEEASVVAEVVSAARVPMRQRRGDLLKVVVTDGVDELAMTFFHPHRGMEAVMRRNARMMFSGTVTSYQGTVQLTQPKITNLPDPDDAMIVAGSLIPVYPASARLGQKLIRDSIRTVLNQVLADGLRDPLPAEVRARRAVMDLETALDAVHRPDDEATFWRAMHRFTFEEAFILQVVLAQRRADERALSAVARAATDAGLLAAFDAALPFELTEAQREVGAQIAADLARESPMHRLLQGEVGSGKTVVAVRAMLTVVDAGGQAALLAPTEVLAAQHHHSITAMLGQLAEGSLLGGANGTRVVLLTGSMPTARRREALLAIASGEAGIVIGTHALLQERVSFADLGLVVVDEQHRFGVEQRNVLRDKAKASPHLLVMTATPIPRTVAMTVFGDLETSTMRQVPAGRPDVATHVVALADTPQWYERIWQRVREEVNAGRQVYVVCPRIDPDDPTDGDAPPDPVDADALVDVPSRGGPGARAASQSGARTTSGTGRAKRASASANATATSGATRPPLRAVVEVLQELRALPVLAGLRIEALHGRMSTEEREATMADFATGASQVLVATTVIEVGVDVPNASVMVVLDADRFGISQLHQLRGRIGRGAHGGVCLLVTPVEAPSAARERLDIVASTGDGFALARADLDARREGDVLGANQSGAHSSLRRLRVLRDEDVIIAARHEATAIVAEDPQMRSHPALADAIDVLLDAERQAFLERG